MRVYLDNCCFNRPFDDLTAPRIKAEAEAKLFIQNLVRYGVIELADSFVLRSEVLDNPFTHRRENILQFIRENAKVYVGDSQRARVEPLASGIMQHGVSAKDAAHIACAMSVDCDCFITTDKRLLKYRPDGMRMLNPVEFVAQWRRRQ
jgi:predicted nucleic acid-binding protein